MKSHLQSLPKIVKKITDLIDHRTNSLNVLYQVYRFLMTIDAIFFQVSYTHQYLYLSHFTFFIWNFVLLNEHLNLRR